MKKKISVMPGAIPVIYWFKKVKINKIKGQAADSTGDW